MHMARAHWILPLAPVLALSVKISGADACSQPVPGVFGMLPVDEPTQLPANGAMLVQFNGELPTVLFNPNTLQEPLVLDLEPFGTGWGLARLPADIILERAIDEAVLSAQQPSSPSEPYARSTRIQLERDLAPPTPVSGVSWNLERVDHPRPCGQNGYYAVATFLQGSRDVESSVFAYVLVEDRPEGLQPMSVIGLSLVNGPVRLERHLGLSGDQVDGRCFGVSAMDRAGNLSSIDGNRYCPTTGAPDAGQPDLSIDGGDGSDAGAADAGVATDAGAQGRDGLNRANEEGCTCGRARSASPGWLLLGWLAVLGLRPRREAEADRA